VTFSSAREAEANGYRSCKICGGGDAEKQGSTPQKETSVR
jgi:methylphosphotriester-DNA--protein-cysteine methyltransferase